MHHRVGHLWPNPTTCCEPKRYKSIFAYHSIFAHPRQLQAIYLYPPRHLHLSKCAPDHHDRGPDVPYREVSGSSSAAQASPSWSLDTRCEEQDRRSRKRVLNTICVQVIPHKGPHKGMTWTDYGRIGTIPPFLPTDRSDRQEPISSSRSRLWFSANQVRPKSSQRSRWLSRKPELWFCRA